MGVNGSFSFKWTLGVARLFTIGERYGSPPSMADEPMICSSSSSGLTVVSMEGAGADDDGATMDANPGGGDNVVIVCADGVGIRSGTVGGVVCCVGLSFSSMGTGVC